MRRASQPSAPVASFGKVEACLCLLRLFPWLFYTFTKKNDAILTTRTMRIELIDKLGAVKNEVRILEGGGVRPGIHDKVRLDAVITSVSGHEERRGAQIFTVA